MRQSSIEDETHELSEKSSLDIESSAADDDQKRGLLDESTGSQEGGTSSQTRPRNRKVFIWWTICLAATAVCLATALWTLMRKAEPEGDHTSRPEITSNDYVLDPKWNYAAPPQRREYKWTIQDHTHNPDGIYRPMILVNNQYPGPLIEANEGDTIVVHVQNQATNATAIHWHGIYQIGTPHMDGTVGVTQCPIAPGRSFTYEFTLIGQSGTYWWHGHQGLQSSDGLHGPLVVHGREEKTLQQIPYDTDRVVLLSDHYHDLSSALLWQYLMPDMENAEPVPESGLINGKNIRSCDDYPDRRCDNTTANVGRAKVVLERNKNHRLRFVNVGAFAEFSVQLDEHELAVTEVDGTDVVPVKYHRLNISPAQRYSVIVSSNVTSADAFWLRARMITNCFTDAPKTLQSDTFAVVRYADSEEGEPKSKDWEEQLAQDCKDMNTTELVPVETQSASSEPDVMFYLRSNFEIGAYRLSRGFFNGSSWRAKADDPTLHRSLDGLNNDCANYTAPRLSSMPLADDRADTAFVNDRAFDINSELVIQTTGVQTIDIMISNFDDGAHPYHLHGYKFSVLAQGHGQPPLTSVGAEINRESLSPLYDTLDLTNPLRRDTASVEGYGWILLRVVADNPGQWAFHCHVSWHAEAGLLMQLLTNTDGLADIKIPLANQDLCAADGINMGMGPKDDDYIEFAK
jgi:FtsP/CotA-like multicopper oxidase with cupredoxin domain